MYLKMCVWCYVHYYIYVVYWLWRRNCICTGFQQLRAMGESCKLPHWCLGPQSYPNERKWCIRVNGNFVVSVKTKSLAEGHFDLRISVNWSAERQSCFTNRNLWIANLNLDEYWLSMGDSIMIHGEVLYCILLAEGNWGENLQDFSIKSIYIITTLMYFQDIWKIHLVYNLRIHKFCESANSLYCYFKLVQW